MAVLSKLVGLDVGKLRMQLSENMVNGRTSKLGGNAVSKD